MRAGRREAVTFGAPNSSRTLSAIRCSHSRLTWPRFAWPIIIIIIQLGLPVIPAIERTLGSLGCNNATHAMKRVDIVQISYAERFYHSSYFSK